RIWAILVGIDGYSQFPLRGCVADALAMEEYLADDLLVPRERIQILLGPRNHSDTVTDVSSLPSHANILSLLFSDPIIIFLAGHGSRYPLSDHDDDEDDCLPKFVEVFCPIDRGTPDSSGVPIPSITDRELNTILSQISRTKELRITVILDC
ncbi:hypothetical protein ARMGADRAFT_880369, partial [Armillaria gallica]